MIDSATPVRLVDNTTKATLSTSTYARVKQLRNRAERMNLNYGAHRFIVVIDFAR